jgi:hypothetical protein
VGFREIVNENRSVTVGAMIGVIVLAIAWILYYCFGGAATTGQLYYTVDDGLTYFADDADRLSPYDHKGKQAVRCFVYKCGENGTPFVAYLERYTADGLKLRQQQMKDKNIDPTEPETGASLLEVKAPASRKNAPTRDWVKDTDPRARAIETVACPDGSKNRIILVVPNE